MKAEIKGLGRACLKARGRCWARHCCISLSDRCISQLLAFLSSGHHFPKHFPSLPQAHQLFSKAIFSPQTPPRKATLTQAQLARSSSQPCCHVLLPPWHQSDLLSTSTGPSCFLLLHPSGPRFQSHRDQPLSKNMKVVLLQTKVVLFLPVPIRLAGRCLLRIQMPSRADPQLLLWIQDGKPSGPELPAGNKRQANTKKRQRSRRGG